MLIKDKDPCKDCPDKQEDDYGLTCNWWCSGQSWYIIRQEAYKAQLRKVIEWLEPKLEPTVPMTAKIDYKEWHAILKEVE